MKAGWWNVPTQYPGEGERKHRRCGDLGVVHFLSLTLSHSLLFVSFGEELFFCLSLHCPVWLSRYVCFILNEFDDEKSSTIGIYYRLSPRDGVCLFVFSYTPPPSVSPHDSYTPTHPTLQFLFICQPSLVHSREGAPSWVFCLIYYVLSSSLGRGGLSGGRGSEYTHARVPSSPRKPAPRVFVCFWVCECWCRARNAKKYKISIMKINVLTRSLRFLSRVCVRVCVCVCVLILIRVCVCALIYIHL